MKRDTRKLADRWFDMLVIGGGINGACVARDAALRGLSVALIDRGDFVSSTSSHSLRIVHGGLRYLQHFDFRRMRQSIRERSTWLRIAPHLVHPLAFAVPTTGRGMRSRSAFRLALSINDVIGIDRNAQLDAARRIPAGRVIGRREMLSQYLGVNSESVTGGAIWHDAQMYSSERLVMAVLRDAVNNGACIANYVTAQKFEFSDNSVDAILVHDRLLNETFRIRARTFVNTCGPLVNQLLCAGAGRKTSAAKVSLSKAMNLFTRRIQCPMALGVSGQHRDPSAAVDHGNRLLFMTPWRDGSLIGTTHEPFKGRPGEFIPSVNDVQRFVDEINAVCPAAQLSLDDIDAVFAGLLPAELSRPGDTEVRLLRHHRIVDHAIGDKFENVISLIGVKFTTARFAAEQAVSCAIAKLHRSADKCQTHVLPIAGGDIEDWGAFLRAAQADYCDRAVVSEIEHIARLYGTDYPKVLDQVGHNARRGKDEVMRAQVLFAVREEMAQSLDDVIRRRTGLGDAGWPGDDVIHTVARIMKDELGWSADREREEVVSVNSVFRAWRNNNVNSSNPDDSAIADKDHQTQSVIS